MTLLDTLTLTVVAICMLAVLTVVIVAFVPRRPPRVDDGEDPMSTPWGDA